MTFPERAPDSEERRAAVLSHAVRQVPHYRERLGPISSHGTPRWDLVPLLTREEADAAGTRLVADGVDATSLRAVRTGGTTGRPATFLRDREDGRRELTHVRNAWQQFGVAVDDPVAVLVARPVGAEGEEHVPHSTGDLWLGGVQLSDDVLRRHHERLVAYRPALLRGYPSALALLAELMLREGRPAPAGLRATGTSSEVLLPYQREILRSAFGVPHANLYGQTEHVALAVTCPAEEGLHVDETYGYVELVDDDGHVITEAEVVGEIVGTGLGNLAAPLLRYRTGDRGRWAPGVCACGRAGPRLDRVEGRVRDVVIDAEGTSRIFGPWFYEKLAGLPGVRAFQFVQRGPGELDVDVVLAPAVAVHVTDVESAVSHLEGFATRVRRVPDVARTSVGKGPLLVTPPAAV
ncbi:phenylacetate--CoA ligase family protein [Cellulomonas sp. zg-ZUI199]|uniref:Phenylacetate--CoA ligase family protein n=1 Tax=Cellulomonas wangleii TaxID=2816956 RepID=A0ABX8DB52_9CELL|nr:phenylacetate--CoA ligase family protein [Cellulomonas wangleii]MBO0924927.1 phenylacetate--CoA ligase family protein [Cellulomonas wangleii]MBO0926811.1 phenylacetate--CoA ligase family protein [Cellulomonas wangleii]QVI63087.1 phenylacetate--CoA ligase family protein [Cellulomonas wangleii]